jgi:hypothetical protein
MATTFESPSKCTASSLKDMSLDSPKKPATSTSTFNPLNKSIAEHSNNDDDNAVVAKPAASQQDLIEDYRTHFVGKVDLDEKDEPLLKESLCCFVPNIMRCTRVLSLGDMFFLLYFADPTSLSRTTKIDMANVQEGRGQLLDCRGDGPL